jgi:rhodanese-related sulfurtransferase
MGNKQTIQKVNFEDIQNILLNNSKNVILINTLENTPEAQSCILPNTIHFSQEEQVINECLQKAKNISLIIYGRNANDITIYQKYAQLHDLGFTNVYVYPGGMFEWMLLQDIYSDEHFKTTTKELDILKFKPKSEMNTEEFSQIRF